MPFLLKNRGDQEMGNKRQTAVGFYQLLPCPRVSSYTEGRFLIKIYFAGILLLKLRLSYPVKIFLCLGS